MGLADCSAEVRFGVGTTHPHGTGRDHLEHPMPVLDTATEVGAVLASRGNIDRLLPEEELHVAGSTETSAARGTPVVASEEVPAGSVAVVAALSSGAQT